MMLSYIVRRTLISLIKLFIFVTILFFVIQVMIPGDYVDKYALGLTKVERDQLRELLGLDVPIGFRYLYWLQDLFRGDLGSSYTGVVPISEILKMVIPPTILVFLTGTLIAFYIGLWLGKRTAWQSSGLWSRVTIFGGVALYSTFPPWLAFLIALAFDRKANLSLFLLTPIGGARSSFYANLNPVLWKKTTLLPHEVATMMIITLCSAVAFVFFIDRLLRKYKQTGLRVAFSFPLTLLCLYFLWKAMGIKPYACDLFSAASLPLITYVLLSFGETMLIMNASMLDVKSEPYITSARAKGLPEGVVREKHAAVNALLPVLSRLVITLPYLLTGIVIIEDALNWPGMGHRLWDAVQWQDMPVIMGVLLIVGVLSLFARLFIDVLSTYLDPRLLHHQGSAFK